MLETHYYISGCPVFLAHLADTHDTDPEPILDSLRRHTPDFILHTGDFIHGKKANTRLKMAKSENAVTLLRECAKLAPTFVAIGNHEAYLSQEDLAAIHSTGVHLLNNNFLTQNVSGKQLVIGGISSGYYSYYQKHKHAINKPDPDYAWLKDFTELEGYHILLMHHPEYYSLIPSSIELIFSGHAHGGQWRFYDLRKQEWHGVYAPDQGIFPKLTSGVIDGRLVISRGLRNTTCIPRIHNPTEIVYISCPEPNTVL